MWGRLSGRSIPGRLPGAAQELLRGFSCDLLDEEDFVDDWILTLADRPHAGRVRDEVKRVAGQVLN